MNNCKGFARRFPFWQASYKNDYRYPISIKPYPACTKLVFLKIVIALLLIPILVVALVFVIPHLYGRFSRILLARRCRIARAIVLTYDDGPGSALSPQLVSILGTHKVKATFFSVGARALERPDLMEILKAEGHEVSCHGFRHCHAWKVTPRESAREILDGFKSLSRWLSKDAAFRPPYGKITLFTWLLLLQRGIRPVWWTHDSGDTWNDRLPKVNDFVTGVIQSGGGVVLLHDFDRIDGDDQVLRHNFVLKVTETLIERAQQADLKLMTLGELFYKEHAIK